MVGKVIPILGLKTLVGVKKIKKDVLDMKISFTLFGQPASKKNSLNCFGSGKKKIVRQNKRYYAYEQVCLIQLAKIMRENGIKFEKRLGGYEKKKNGELRMHNGKPVPIFAMPRLHLKAIFHRKNSTKIDINNMLAALTDILQKSGIIEDDAYIESFDGTRRFYRSDDERTEIYICDDDG